MPVGDIGDIRDGVRGYVIAVPARLKRSPALGALTVRSEEQGHALRHTREAACHVLPSLSGDCPSPDCMSPHVTHGTEKMIRRAREGRAPSRAFVRRVTVTYISPARWVELSVKICEGRRMDERPVQPPEGKLISEALARKGLSIREASRRANISYGRWRQITSGYQNISPGVYAPVRAPAATVARMAGVVGVTAAELEQAGRVDAGDAFRDQALTRRPTAADTEELPHYDDTRLETFRTLAVGLDLDRGVARGMIQYLKDELGIHDDGTPVTQRRAG